eukprot:TRINITY_DN7243_c0_g1_i1.p1 TRINITY_DN7243_c0_g1~~TRINITY_DN7243_c0_g1_i1.p1  ORF type:complete len:631 (+),score=137.51 TRINITY_DN7243_c0_g1_i1:27-1919(+)
MEGGVTFEESIRYMTQGTSLLKCSARGYPHFRVFTLSEDYKILKWTSPKKDFSSTSVRIADVKEMRLGQKTVAFKKTKRPELEHLSFSLIYSSNQEKTLDVVCKDKKELELWVTGLKTLITDPSSSNNTNNIINSSNNNNNSSSLSNSASNPKSPPRLLKKQDSVNVEFRGSKTIVKKVESFNDVYSWGQGSNGRLGHRDESDQFLPRVIESLLNKDIIALSCGPSHSAAWTSSGDLYTWGSGHSGRLGQGHERDRFTPFLVPSLSQTHISQVSCGDYHTLALTEHGKVYAWGLSGNGRLGLGQIFTHDQELVLTPQSVPKFEQSEVTVKQIACGYISSGAITTDGKLYMWGGSEKGQLGFGNDKGNKYEPTELVINEAGKKIKIGQLACGTWHTACVTEFGENILTWGEGANGKLGHEDECDQLVPKAIPRFKSVGSNSLVRISQISCGNFHTAILSTDGTVYCWGEGSYGQLGLGPNITKFGKPAPLVIGEKDSKVVQISCGANHTAALLGDGRMFSWGYGMNGRLGHGNETDCVYPKQIEAMKDKKVRYIVCGGSHTGATTEHKWVPDAEAGVCMGCKASFTMLRRRHHCRSCGGLFCGECSSKKKPLLKEGFGNAVRVCDTCFGQN